MKKLAETEDLKVERPTKAELSPEETLKRMEEFPERKEELVAAVREGKSRSLRP